MKLLDIGVEKRILTVQDEVSSDKSVHGAEEAFNSAFNVLIEQAKASSNTELVNALMDLEALAGNLGFFYTVAAHRIGMSDGLRLHQELKELTGSAQS